jgi:hypothetical protein
MSEVDPLRPVLREWQTPEPSAELDQRVLAGFRAASAPNPWTRFWSARVSIPMPVLAAAILMLAVAWLIERRPAAPVTSPPSLVTRFDATGFQPLPEGAARVMPVEDVRQ